MAHIADVASPFNEVAYVPMNGNLCWRRTDVTAYTKRKGRLRRHKRPKSREETPEEGSNSGVGGRYRTTPSKTITIGGSIERRVTSGI